MIIYIYIALLSMVNRFALKDFSINLYHSTLQTLVNGPYMGFEWVSHKFMGIWVYNMLSTCLTYERTTWSLMGKKYVNSHMGIISLAHKLSHYVMTMWDTYGIDKATPYAKLKKKQKTILRGAIHIGSTWLRYCEPINKMMGLSYMG